MTIDELIAELTRRRAMHGNVHVQVTWESMIHHLFLPSIYLSKQGALLIDADSNYYKDSYQHPDDVVNNREAAQ